jgi:predicted Zn finger-like uncharacterized protein
MSNSEDIVTRCPQCNTAFRVTVNQLAVADGQVRCGSCLAVFKAVDHEARKARNRDIKPPVERKVEIPITPKESRRTRADTPLTASPSAAVNLAENYPAKPPTTNKSPAVLGTADSSRKESTLKQTQETTAKSVQKHQTKLDTIAPTSFDETLTTDDSKYNRPNLDDDAFGLDSENDNSETSAFDRELDDAVGHRRDNIDESWAEEMLADLDEEKRDGKLNSQYAVKIEPSDELDDFDDSAASRGSNYSQINLDTYRDNGGQSGRSSTPHFSRDSGDSGEIEAGESKLHELSSLEPDLYDNTNREVFEPGAASIGGAIDNTVSSRTHRKDDLENYLANIEPEPVEMMAITLPSTRRWLWRAGAIITGLLLLIQIVTLRFDTLSKNPSYRPFFSSTCTLIGCSLPSLVDTRQIRATNLIVRSHPRRQNALIIDAILINNAQFSQVFPGLQLEFKDIDNQLVASRQLQPVDYLRGELAGAKIMANNQPIQLSIEIVDPGDTAVNYRLTVVQARLQDHKN